MKRETDRGGFTLIELLVVTVVIVTLMGIVFRLAGVSGEGRAKAVTLERLQRLENALSGYYAAYGSYPPVPLQGRSRSIYKQVDEYGRQEDGEEEKGGRDLKKTETMEQILIACRAQPISVSWPASDRGGMKDIVSDFAQDVKADKTKTYENGFDIIGGLHGLENRSKWRGEKKGEKSAQLFEFGLLSFLFPRYFFMLEAPYDDFYENADGQWAANNQIPCRLDTGMPYQDWETMRKDLGLAGAGAKKEAGMISNLTSQAACARWMPNFKGIVTAPPTSRYRHFFGVDIADGEREYFSSGTAEAPQSDLGLSGENIWLRSRLRVYTPGGYDSTGDPYLLLCLTVLDGWSQEFFYYSDPPYQSYRLWSAGPNKVTFPPWYDLSVFSNADLEQIRKFTSDDIAHLSN